jgi:hypothetical protein
MGRNVLPAGDVGSIMAKHPSGTPGAKSTMSKEKKYA